ncbi:MAG: T9SS type A sorting domain-containing protein [Candidatus Marinimicrobia bacterium]|nr:T9SS type A sorting domain-containing protein [Candidatus Neomarinimicrobiota bacterium]
MKSICCFGIMLSFLVLSSGIAQNAAPVFETDPLTQAYVDSTYSYEIQISDPDIDLPILTTIQTADWLNPLQIIDPHTQSLSVESDCTWPYGITIDNQGWLWVVDYIDGELKRMTTSGNDITIIDANLYAPTDVVVSPLGQVWVADTGYNRIKRMNFDGTGIVVLSEGLDQPAGLCIAADGFIWIADAGNDAIKRMSPDMSQVEVIGSGFSNPRAVAEGPDGRIWVADTGHDLIKSMSPDGSDITVIGSGFSAPYGIDVGPDTTIWIMDTGNGCLKHMGADGSEVVTAVSGLGSPMHVFVDPDNDVWASTVLLNSIRRFLYRPGHFRLTGVPALSDVGNHWISLLADDGHGGTETQSFTIVVDNVNDPPLGMDTTFSCHGEETISIDWTITDADADVLEFVLITPPALGSVLFTMTTLTYIPNLGASGTDVLQYQLWDALDSSTVYTVSIYINQPPVFTSTPDSIAYEDALYQYSISTQDPDGMNVWVEPSELPGWLSIGQDAGSYLNSETIYWGLYYGTCGISMDPSGYLWVADTWSDRILKMTLDGSSSWVIQTEVHRPGNALYGPDGRIWTNEHFDDRILAMDMSGDNLTTIVSGLVWPKDIAFAGDSLLWIAEYGRVSKRNLDGSNVQEVGTGFQFPTCIHIDPTGMVWVGDKTLNELIRMNQDGSDQTTIVEGLDDPTGVRVLNNGNVAVSTQGTNDRVAIYTQEGVFVEQLSNYGANTVYELPDGSLIYDRSSQLRVAQYQIGDYWLEGTPVRNDVGSHSIELTAADVNGATATAAFTVQVLSMNNPPTGLELVQPQMELIVNIQDFNLTDSLKFIWEGAEDLDGDSLTYLFHSEPHVQGFWESLDMYGENSGSIQYTELIDLVDSVLTITWSIYVTDGVDTSVAENGPFVFTVDRTSVVGVREKSNLPERIELFNNYPNPFNPTTTINYSLPEISDVKLTVFDIRGQEVTTLQNGIKSPGKYEVHWKGMDRFGNPVSTGVYFCRLEAGAYSQTIKMMYLR